MRDIKFRAWHTELKKMFSAEEMGQDELTLSVNGRGFVNVSGTSTRLSQYFGETMIPLEYTGIKDKNGVEIFEGDIVVPRVMEDDNVCFWRSSNSKFEPIPQEIKWENCGFELPTWDTKMGSWEVIGNIYENPELLEGKI